MNIANSHNFFKILLLGLLNCLINSPIYAQLTIRHAVDHPSATASQMTKYGLYNPQLYTGNLSLSIPIYTYQDNDFTIPISLNYSYNGLMVNKQAGLTGLGWSLDYGGYITREVRGIPDEETGQIRIYNIDAGDFSDTPTELFSNLYGFDAYPQAFTSTEGVLLQPINEELDNPYNIFQQYRYVADSAKNYEVTSDIYHFSFMGKTGSFTRVGQDSYNVYHTNTFDGDYKIHKHNQDLGDGSGNVTSYITIQTSEGYKYTFGDIPGDGSFSYTERKYYDNEKGDMTDNHEVNTILAWVLRKIEAPNGRVVEFRNDDGKEEINVPVTNYRCELWYNSYSDSSPQASTTEATTTICPIDEIAIDNGQSIFLEYGERASGALYINGITGNSEIINTPCLLTKITTPTGLEAELSYSYNSSGNKYPFLNEVNIKGYGKYRMEYKTEGYFPPNGTTAMDHWGYANSSNQTLCNSNRIYMPQIVSLQNNNVETLTGYRSPNFNVSSLGVLQRIFYPTGGSTKFFWEANSYTKEISKNIDNGFSPSLVTTLSQEGAGGRVWKSVNYDLNGVAKDSTSYKYVEAPSSSISSGIQLIQPRYEVVYSGNIEGIGKVFRYYYSGGIVAHDAIPIEYPTVITIHPDSSYTVDHFSSYLTNPDEFADTTYRIPRAEDIGGRYHVGLLTIANNEIANFNAVHNILTPPTSYQFKRGKPILQEIYSKDNQLLTRSTTDYTNYSDNPTILDLSYVGDAYRIRHLLTEAYPASYTSKESIFNNGSLTEEGKAAYNSYGLKTKNVTISSTGDTTTTYYTYITDIPDIQRTAVQDSMLSRGLIAYPIREEVKIKRKRELIESLVDGSIYTFAQYPGIQGNKLFLPAKIEKIDNITNQAYTEALYKYDLRGNIIEQRNANNITDSFLWGDDNLGVSVIAENATNEQIISILGVNAFNTTPSDEASVQEIYNNLKAALPSARLWYYTYFSAGLPLKVCAPDGCITTYEYDSLARLKRVYNSKMQPVEGYDYSTITQEEME